MARDSRIACNMFSVHTISYHLSIARQSASGRPHLPRPCLTTSATSKNVTLLPSTEEGSSDRQGRDLTWKIREACKADWGDVCQLHCETFHPTSTWLGGAWLRSQRHKAFEDWVSNSSEALAVIGTVCVDSTGQHVPPRIWQGRPEKRVGVAYLSNLAVNCNARRRGIGRQLLDQAAQVAKAWGCRSIILECDPQNEGARNMYIQGGYRHVAFEPIFTSLWEGRLGQRLELMCKLLRK